MSNCQHRGQPVEVGQYEIFAGGKQFLRAEDLDGIDVLIPLQHGLVPMRMGQTVQVLACPWKDFAPSPGEGFKQFLLEMVIPLLREGKKVLVHCTAGHGRTGTFIASLIALLEDFEHAPDPVEIVRERYCSHAVETDQQEEFVFSLRRVRDK